MTPDADARLAIGFRVKSGYAIAIVVGGRARAPVAVARHIVELSDPDVASTKQPYHSGVGEAEEDQREIARRVKIVTRVAAKSVAALLDRCERPASQLRAALVVGSVIDPASVGNPHIRAHANEGRLFRTVLVDALAAHRVESSVVVEKQLAAAARRQLACSEAEIKRTLAGFGKILGSPWRTEEKSAATAGWMALQGSTVNDEP